MFSLSCGSVDCGKANLSFVLFATWHERIVRKPTHSLCHTVGMDCGKAHLPGFHFFCYMAGVDSGKADLSSASAHHLRGIQSASDLFLRCSLTNESSVMVVTSVVGCVVWDANLDDRFRCLSLPCPKKKIVVVFLLTALHSELLHVWQVPILFYWGVSNAYEFCCKWWAT